MEAGTEIDLSNFLQRSGTLAVVNEHAGENPTEGGTPDDKTHVTNLPSNCDTLAKYNLNVDQQRNDRLKVRPPFSNLPIFNVSAIILAFFGYRDDVMDLLDMLSHGV